MRKYLFALAAVALLFACKKEEKTAAITAGVDEITYYSAVLKGKAVLGPTVSADWKVGFQYSTSPGIMPANSTTVEAADADAKYNYSVAIEGLTPETTYYFRAFIRENGQDTYGETKEFKTGSIPKGAVDLGVVITREDGTTYALYWAESNLCETGLCANPEDYGDYYAWGETVPHYLPGHGSDIPLESWRDGTEGYTWGTYKWTKGSASKLTKYCPKGLTAFWAGEGTPDGKTELDPEDDPARLLGGKWRMPTKAEWEALISLCDCTFTYRGDSSRGLLVTAPNKNSIFLPVQGVRYGLGVGSSAYGYCYWSSTLSTKNPNDAYTMANTDLSDDAPALKDSYDRYRGLAIRPVTE